MLKSWISFLSLYTKVKALLMNHRAIYAFFQWEIDLLISISSCLSVPVEVLSPYLAASQKQTHLSSLFYDAGSELSKLLFFFANCLDVRLCPKMRLEDKDVFPAIIWPMISRNSLFGPQTVTGVQLVTCFM